VLCFNMEDYIPGAGYRDLEMDGVEYVFHMGAISSTDANEANMLFNYNYGATFSLANLCYFHNAKMIFASSASIYGNNDGMGGNNWYAWSKKTSEDYIGARLEQNGVCLRYFNVYGPGEAHKGRMASVAYQAMKHRANNIRGAFGLFLDDEPERIKRDFVYIDDVVDATIMAMEAKGGIYEVGTGESRPFQDVLDILEVPHTIAWDKTIPKGYQFKTESFNMTWIPGWTPKFTLEEGLAKYREEFEKSLV